MGIGSRRFTGRTRRQMRTMGEGRFKRMDNLGSFGGFQETNSGITLDAFCQNLPSALGGRDCGRRIRIISF